MVEPLGFPMDPRSSSFRRAWLLAFVSCVVLVVLSYLFVDRAASTWAHEHLHRPKVTESLTHLVDPLEPASVIGLMLAGLAAGLAGWRPGRHGRTFIAACLAIIVAVMFKNELKFVFGRTWPETWINGNPSWIGNHVFGFNFFHGGSGYESFPSGHTARMAALASVLWHRFPRFRSYAVAMVGLVAVALWGCDYHFVSDIIAGGFLGWACGVGAVALVCREDRKPPSGAPGSDKR
ncbi:PAP2 superfamily protein [mine drainage metagenome]|uniref:PAP2 superfamily protein n=1 Tax=mine drainage metagenome TaxID=410659 RepID=A0A1J5SUP8_9ZZZZ